MTVYAHKRSAVTLGLFLVTLACLLHSVMGADVHIDTDPATGFARIWLGNLEVRYQSFKPHHLQLYGNVHST